MKNRVIGGTGFVILFVLMTFTAFYQLMYLFFAGVGIYEGYQIYRNKRESQLYLISIYIIVFLVAIYSMLQITSFNPGFMLYIAVLIMFNDTFAFFVGRKFGRHKLSKISPKKTVEGAVGGMILGIIVANLLMASLKFIDLGQILIFNFNSIKTYMVFDNLVSFIIISIIVVLLALLGDLFESKIKRTYQVKDSGTIVYGHGGILDRLDSWVLTSIFILIIISFI